MNFNTSKIPLLIVVLYQLAGLPILIKYGPIFMSHSHGIVEAYPLFLYGAGWVVIFGSVAVLGRRQEISGLGLSSLPRTSGKGVHFPREKAWLYGDMPVSLAHPGREGRGHIECLSNRIGSIVIFWLPRNLRAGLFVNNLDEEPTVVRVRSGFLLYEISPDWKYELLPVHDPSCRTLRYVGRGNVETVLHSGNLLKRMSELIDLVSPLQGRIVIEDSLVAAYFPRELPQGDALFSTAYGLWQEVVAAQWPRKRFNPFENWRSAVSLLGAAAIISAFIMAIAFSLTR